MRKRTGVILAVIGYIVFFFCMEGWGSDWKHVTIDAQGAVWKIDTASISPQPNNFVRTWVKVTHSKQSKNNFLKTMGKRRRDKFKNLSYNKALYEFHCIEKKYRILSITSYSFDDEVLQSGNVPLEWDFVVPDSMAELLSKVVCK